MCDQTREVEPAGEPESRLTLTTSTSTESEQTAVTIGGVLADPPESAPVKVQYAWGQNPSAAAWTTATTVPTTDGGSYEGSFTVPVPRNAGTNGAPQLNVRALADGAVSPVKAYLLRTWFEGTYVMYKNGDVAGENTFVVFYSDRAWRMFFGAVEVRGTTQGWDLLDSSNLRFHATYHDPGEICERPGTDDPDCHGDEDDPWIEYVATWTSDDDDDMRIEGLAVLDRT